MINMFGPMMYGGMNSMYGSMTSGNVPQYFKQRYASGYEDIGTKPYVRSYPMGINPIPQVAAKKESWISRLIRKCFF